MKILITGGTGFVGKKLISKLLENNHEINVLTRNIASSKNKFDTDKIHFYEWNNFSSTPPKEAFAQIDAIINLMGENIGGKLWSAKQKDILISSRVQTTKNLVQVVNELNLEKITFINASAIGIYPVNEETILNESSSFGTGFLSQLCIDWEAPLNELKGIQRKVLIRTGVVLDKNDGALKKMLPPFYLGAGGPLGDGKQMMSWIHVDDLVALYVDALTNININGPINACSPNPVSNLEFTKALGKAIHRPTIFPVPKPIIKLLFGEMSTVILDSQDVVSNKVSNSFFKYPKIDQAFQEIFK
jgi:uncharacterized protein (TIGR01777 family)